MGTDPQGAASSALLIPRMASFAASLSLVYASSLYSSPLSGRLPRLYLDGFAGGPYEGYPDIWEPMGDGEGIAFKRGGQGTYRSGPVDGTCLNAKVMNFFQLDRFVFRK